MANDLIPELITEIAKDFEEHLALPNNSRILFSGRFGKGKTTFLEEYFKDESAYNKSGNSYNVFHLKPVNYSIASNEDIFRYLKYDIILEFIRKNYDPERYDFSFRDVLPYYILKNPEKVIKGFIEYIPKVGKLITEFFEKLESLYNDIKTFRDNINNSAPSNQLSSFLEKIEVDEYSIYENDGVTKIIEKVLKELEGESEEKKKENILIIDDLDRIDPGHIFRLLNVFSAHFDDHYAFLGKGNKFGFDKVILVCDVRNIREIFRNKYGINVDFKGYIDKFYSSKIFFFSNYEQLINACNKLVRDADIKLERATGKLSFLIDKSGFNLLSLVNNFLQFDMLTLRGIKLSLSNVLKIPKRQIFLDNDVTADIYDIPFFYELQILKDLFSSFLELESSLKRLQEISMGMPYIDSYFKFLIYISQYRIHRFLIYDGKFEITLLNTPIFCSLKSSNGKIQELEIFEATNGEKVFAPQPKFYYSLLLTILEDLHNQKSIN